MKKKIVPALILLALFTVGFLVGVFVIAPMFNRTPARVPTEEMLRFAQEYEALNGTETAAGPTLKHINIPEYNLMRYSSPEEILFDLLEGGGTGLVLFSFPQCPWCRQMMPLLIDTALEMGLPEIFYLNMMPIRTIWELRDGVPVMTNPGHPHYQDMLVAFERVIEPLPLNPFHLTDEDGNRINTEELRIFVPTVVAIRDGRIVDWHVYTSERAFPGNEGGYQWYPLDDAETAELRAIYERVIGAMRPDDCGDSWGC
ncbi:MAG: hypothetical protein FWB76_06910 [Oscillospiraceae bacterium]|nr:hypothetical protein [Oscillospiraceae bacterium]